jgi:hypothetical protein
MNKSTSTHDIFIEYNDKQISNTTNTKFIGLFINDTLSWKTYIYYIIPKLSSASYATRSVKLNVLHKTLRIIYYNYFNSITNYGLLLWGHSSGSAKIFRLQKNLIRIMLGCRSRDSCRNLFMKLKMLPLPSQYIYIYIYFLLFVIKNRNQYTVNSKIHHINTRQHSNFHLPIPRLTKYQKGNYCLGLKVYSGFLLISKTYMIIQTESRQF